MLFLVNKIINNISKFNFQKNTLQKKLFRENIILYSKICHFSEVYAFIEKIDFIYVYYS